MRFVDDAAVQTERDHAIAAQLPDPSHWIPRSTGLLHRVAECHVGKGHAYADDFIDIADTLDVKLAALREHRSQLGAEDLAPMITEWARTQGKRGGLAAAEAFRQMLLDDS